MTKQDRQTLMNETNQINQSIELNRTPMTVKNEGCNISTQIKLKEHERRNEPKNPMTKEDFQTLMNEINKIKQAMGLNTNPMTVKYEGSNIFTEVKTKEHEGKNEPKL